MPTSQGFQLLKLSLLEQVALYLVGSEPEVNAPGAKPHETTNTGGGKGKPDALEGVPDKLPETATPDSASRGRELPMTAPEKGQLDNTAPKRGNSLTSQELDAEPKPMGAVDSANPGGRHPSTVEPGANAPGTRQHETTPKTEGLDLPGERASSAKPLTPANHLSEEFSGQGRKAGDEFLESATRNPKLAEQGGEKASRLGKEAGEKVIKENADEATQAIETSVKRPEAPSSNRRSTHHAEPEVEPGVVAKEKAADGHDIKVLKDGRVVRCSTCAELQETYAEVLEHNSDLQERLHKIEKITDPIEKAKQAQQLEQELKLSLSAEAETGPILTSRVRDILKNYDLSNAPDASQVVSKAWKDTFIDKHVLLAKDGATAKEARKQAQRAADRQAKSIASQQAINAAETRALVDLQNDNTFKPNPDLEKIQKDYDQGKVGHNAKNLSSRLTERTYKEILDILEADVNDKHCKKIASSFTVGGGKTKHQISYQYSDGSLVRVKPLGDANFDTPMYSIEVVKDPSLPLITGQEDVAFKLDAGGKAVPKGPDDLNNPYDEGTNSTQYRAYLEQVMKAGHLRAKP